MKSRKITIVALLLLTSVIIYSCKKDPTFEPSKNGLYQFVLRSFPEPLIAKDNPLTTEGIKLGRMLFYETMLSRDGSQSCASCHNQKTAFSDTSKFSIGIKGLPGKRQAMAVFNMAWHGNEFFWDGRAHLLRDQSLKPIEDPLEMDDKLDNVIAKLGATNMYPNQFMKAFGTTEITPFLMSKALEQFMNSIVSNSSKYDDYLEGKATLTAEEERGRFLFFNEFVPSLPAQSGADCAHCHSGLQFMNNKYMNNGLDDDATFTDIGREAVTGNASDKGKFKVPSLRNIELTPPYMHDGRFKTLREVVTHYNKDVKSSSTLDGAIRPTVGGLHLVTQDVDALIAFLKTLTDKTLATNPEYSSPF